MAQAPQFVNNAGPNTVEGVFRELSRTARSLRAVTAFATTPGVNAVLPYIRRIAERGHVSITVGFYHGVTDPSALRVLYKAARATRGKLIVNVATMPNLHRK